MRPHQYYKHRPPSLRHFSVLKKPPHSWSTQTKYKGPQDSQSTPPPGANTEQYGHKPVHIHKPNSQLSGRTEKHSIAIAPSKDTGDPSGIKQSKQPSYCMGLSHPPVTQEHFLRKSHFNSEQDITTDSKLMFHLRQSSIP